MRYCIRRNGQLSDTPFLSTGSSLEHASEPSPSSFPKRASQRDLAVRSVDDSHVAEELSGQSTSPEQSTSFDLYRWANQCWCSITRSSMPVGSLDFRNLQTLREKRKEKYTLGVFLMTVRPRVEGRFFVKEFVFDSSGHNGRVLFSCDPPEPGKTSLAHVMESMNETEWVLGGASIVARRSTCRPRTAATRSRCGTTRRRICAACTASRRTSRTSSCATTSSRPWTIC